MNQEPFLLITAWVSENLNALLEKNPSIAEILVTICALLILYSISIRAFAMLYRSLISLVMLIFYLSLVSFVVWFYLNGILNSTAQIFFFLFYMSRTLLDTLSQSNFDFEHILSGFASLSEKLNNGQLLSNLSVFAKMFYKALGGLTNLYLQNFEAFKNETIHKLDSFF